MKRNREETGTTVDTIPPQHNINDTPRFFKHQH